MRCAMLMVAFLCGLGLVGCGSGGSTSGEGQAAAPQGGAGAAGSPGAPAAKPKSIPANASPDQVVALFLDSLRGGDQATTASLLTAKALTETSQRNLSVCPQATPNMQYQITQAEVLADNPNGAHVNVVWTEKYTDGDVTYEVVWVLRRQQEGWRIAGMAIELVPGQGLAFLNFEDPDDMIRKQEEAMAALNPPAAETAALPDQGFQGNSANQSVPQEGAAQDPSQNFVPADFAPSNGSAQNPVPSSFAPQEQPQNFQPQNFAPPNQESSGFSPPTTAPLPPPANSRIER